MRYRRIKSFDDLKPGTLIISRVHGTVAVITRNSNRANDLKGFVTFSYLYDMGEFGSRVFGKTIFESNNHHWMLPQLMKEYRLLTKNI
jgi:hypothetical protein